MKNTGNAARDLYLGAKVHALVEAQVDDQHKSKGAELRIEKPAKLYTTKTIVVNEVKGIKLPGDVDGIVVNGGDIEKNGLKIPANYSFLKDSRGFVSEKNSNDNPVWFADYNALKEIANMGNDGEIIRLTAIRDDLNKQIAALNEIKKANEEASKLHVIED